MKIIALLIKNSKVVFIIATISAIIGGLSFSGIIYVINEGIQSEMADPQPQIIKFVIIWALYGITSVVSVYAITKAAQNVILNLRLSISQKILKATFSKLEYQSDKILTILTTDINTISNSVNRLPNTFKNVAVILGCFVYMLYISPVLMGMFSILIFITYLLNKIPLQSYKKRMRNARDLQGDVFRLFEGLVHGLKELNLNRKLRDSYLFEILIPTATAQKDQNVQGRTSLAFFNKSGEMVLFLGMELILLVVSIYITAEFKIMIQFLMVALIAIAPLSQLGNFLPVLGQMDVAFEKIAEIGVSLDSTAREKDVKLLAKPEPAAPLAKLKDVTYEYFVTEEDKHFVLGPINLEINPGELIFVVGGNGSGKSTLAKVICGLYLPKTGQIDSFGETIDYSNIDSYREQFNAVFTDYYLFNHFGHIENKNAMDEAKEIIRMLELEKKVKVEDNQLSTTSLSTGQRKRLALLLALLEDKPFYIFDEWAASQDPYYKDVYYTKILPDLKKQGKTVLVISHDDRYFNIADKVLVLRDGQLTQSDMDNQTLVNTVYNVPNS